jgi:hypothetical protein
VKLDRRVRCLAWIGVRRQSYGLDSSCGQDRQTLTLIHLLQRGRTEVHEAIAATGIAGESQNADFSLVTASEVSNPWRAPAECRDRRYCLE